MGATDRIDLRPQRARVHECQQDLDRALAEMEKTAKHARRTLRHARQLDLAGVHGAASAVRRAEEALDIAQLDLHTASGHDA